LLDVKASDQQIALGTGKEPDRRNDARHRR
jgi:hypothetical protein